MYGLVNRAIEELVCTHFNEESWEAIKAHAGVTCAAFISMEAYPDQLTYDLIAATSHELQLPAETVLEQFGEYWTLYTAREGYGELLKLSGKTLAEFLANLDTLHTRVSLLYPELRPPSFACTEVNDAGLLLHYHSHREGMAHLVIGILHGLRKQFAINFTIDHEQKRHIDGDHDAFRLTYTDAAED